MVVKDLADGRRSLRYAPSRNEPHTLASRCAPPAGRRCPWRNAQLGRTRRNPGREATPSCKHCGQCERCKKGKCKPKPNGQACDGGGTCQSGRCVPPFCAGKNSCQEGNAITTCQGSGSVSCVCVGTAASGAPFCAENTMTSFTVDCTATPCPAGETCVNLAGGSCDPPDGPGGQKWARPCPNPL